MRLNVINQTAVVRAACVAGKVKDLNPRFGAALQLNEAVFKYTVMGDPKETLVVERIDLGKLFSGIPQDITPYTFNESVGGDLSALHEASGVDTTQQENVLEIASYEAVAPTDVLGQHFINWKRLVGLDSLSRAEVELGVLDDHLVIDARNSTVYRGTVSVKFK